MLSIFHQVHADIASGIAKKLNTSYEKDMSKLHFLGSHNGFANDDKKFATKSTCVLSLPLVGAS